VIRSKIAAGLVAAIAFQLVVLAGMVVNAALPLWTGTEIRVRTVPVDPRSMFRGNYARLGYEFGTLPANALHRVKGLRPGEVVYVSLEPDDDDEYVFAGASFERPAEGVFLRGRLATVTAPYRVRYGIEAFFAPKEEALELEKGLRNGGIAVLMVTGSGRAALKDVVPEPNPAPTPDADSDPTASPETPVWRDQRLFGWAHTPRQPNPVAAGNRHLGHGIAVPRPIWYEKATFQLLPRGAP